MANPKIKDQVTGLLELYAFPQLGGQQILDILKNHFHTHGRLGRFTKYNDAEKLAFEIHDYIKSLSDLELEKERRFYTQFLSKDLSSQILGGFKRAKQVMPDINYEDPTIIFTLDGPLGDARALGPREFAINLTNLYRGVRHLSENVGLDRACSKIETMVAHEANHIYLKQITGRDKSAHWLYDTAFDEGLATLVEPEHHKQHQEYLNNIGSWLIIVDKATKAKTLDDKMEVLSLMADDKTLQKYQPDTIEKIKEATSKGTDIPHEEFNALLREAMVERNGAAYHVGFHMWKKIQEKHGIEKVKDLAQKGTYAFLEAYASAK
jgi:hypothetical protein